MIIRYFDPWGQGPEGCWDAASQLLQPRRALLRRPSLSLAAFLVRSPARA